MARLPSGHDYNSPDITLVGFNPPPGAQQPGKYPIPPGIAYQKWGEQAGYKYNPYSDEYTPDPQAQQKFYEESGLQPKKPKQPGALEGIGTIAAGAGAAALGGQLIKDPSKVIGGLSSGASKLGNAIGLGSQTAGATNAGAASAGGAGSAPSGLLGVSDAAQSAPGLASRIGGWFGGGGGVAPAVPQVIGSNLTGAAAAANPAIQAGNATMGAYTAGTAAAPGLAGSAPAAAGGVGLLGAAGAAAGAYGLYDVGTHHYEAPRSVLQGAASGAAIGSVIPGVGTVIGGAIGGLIGLASSSMFNPQGGWKKETKKLEKLQKGGAYLPPGLLESMPTKARKLEDLIRKDMPADFVGRDPQGNWVNNKFAKSRNVADLQGTDIVNYAAFAEQDPDWFRKPLEERLVIADRALQAGAVKEHHGTLDVDFSKVNAANVPPPGTPPAAGQPAPAGTAPATPPPKGTRLSPGVYADGRGGSTTKR